MFISLFRQFIKVYLFVQTTGETNSNGDCMERVILHSDLNSFYANVECFANPKIRDSPVVVGGSEDLRNGIILAKNELAKKFGIVTGEPVWQAKQKCPQLVSVAPDFEKYLKFSRLARKIYERYTDQIESFGIDECWLDVTASTSLFGTGEQIADEIRTTIKREMGITASVGVSYNKIFAKLGSDMKKPDATTVITRENYQEKVWSLPVGDLLYVGRSTKKKLSRLGIHTIGDLANADLSILTNNLGAWGVVLHQFANGKDDSPVKFKGEESFIKSVGNSMTLHRDVDSIADVKKVFYLLADSVASRLREHGLKASAIQIMIRDNNFISCSRQSTLETPTYLILEIAEMALKIFKQKYEFNNPVRSLGIRATNLKPHNTPLQMDIFTDHATVLRTELLEQTIDNVRRRYGYDIINRGIIYEDRKLTGVTPKEDNTIHPVSFFDGKIIQDYDLKKLYKK